MATSQTEAEVVTDFRRCRDIVSELMKCDVIAVDAEGVQLGKDGPLTLLQICTMEYQAYLFDVQVNKGLFTDGHLRDLLQSPKTTKVMHSCSGDSAALYYQFNIRLQGVFDTQIAHIVIEEDKGTALAGVLKLEDICSRYSSTATLPDQKTSLKEKWLTEAGDLWARRPLTSDMIKYAAGDVIAIIPEVYQNQKRYVDDHNLQEKLKSRVEEEIMLIIDDKVLENRRERVRQTVKTVLTKYNTNSSDSVTYPDITDDDVINALRRISMDNASIMSSKIKRLKTESLSAELDEIEEKLNEDITVVTKMRFFALRDCLNHEDARICQKAKRLQDRITNAQVDIMAKKYGSVSQVLINYLSEPEKQTLKKLRPSSVNDPAYPRVVLELYWKLMQAELETTFTELQHQGRNFRMNGGYYRKIKFFMSKNTPVPLNLKKKAREFIQLSEKFFGRNGVPQ